MFFHGEVNLASWIFLRSEFGGNSSLSNTLTSRPPGSQCYQAIWRKKSKLKFWKRQLWFFYFFKNICHKRVYFWVPKKLIKDTRSGLPILTRLNGTSFFFKSNYFSDLSSLNFALFPAKNNLISIIIKLYRRFWRFWVLLEQQLKLEVNNNTLPGRRCWCWSSARRKWRAAPDKLVSRE